MQEIISEKKYHENFTYFANVASQYAFIKFLEWWEFLHKKRVQFLLEAYAAPQISHLFFPVINSNNF